MGDKWNRKRKDRGKRNQNTKKERTNDGNHDEDNNNIEENKEQGTNNNNNNNNNRRGETNTFHYDKFNWKMESYYAFQGLHSIRKISENENADTTVLERQQYFVPCQTDAEMEEERKKWKDILAVTLPASFRIAQNQDQDLRDRMERELDAFMGTEFEITVKTNLGKVDDDKEEGTGCSSSSLNTAVIKKKMAPVKRIPFIPHAYQLSIDRRTISRDPLLESFHNWLMMNCEAGFLSRLETVSMIPPVVLQPEPHHHILVCKI